MAFSTFSWPPWVEVWADTRAFVTRIRVTHGAFHYDFEVPYDSTSRDTLRICYQVRAGLVEKERTLAAITKRLTP